MKKLFVLLLFVFTTICYSQTTTKKYNDLRNRWEYYNSSHQMVGYEKYNSLKQQWEYTDLSQNVSSRVHDYGDPQSTFDADLAIMALAAKQKQYNNRKQYRKKEIQYVLKVIEKAIQKNGEKVIRLNDRNKWNEVQAIFAEWWSDYTERNINTFTYSNADLIVSHINRRVDDAIEEVNKKYQKIGNLKKKREKTQETIDGLLRRSERLATMGGYTSTIIVEYKWNPTTEQFEFDRELNINSKVYFDKNRYAFKRGDNPWKYANWTFLGEDKNTGEYVYYDNYGQNLKVNFTEHTVTWYMNKENSVWTKVVVWANLTSDPTIKLKH